MILDAEVVPGNLCNFENIDSKVGNSNWDIARSSIYR